MVYRFIEVKNGIVKINFETVKINIKIKNIDK